MISQLNQTALVASILVLSAFLELFVKRQALLCPRMLELRHLEKLRRFGELVQRNELPRGVWVVSEDFFYHNLEISIIGLKSSTTDSF